MTFTPPTVKPPQESFWADAHLHPRSWFYQRVAHENVTRFQLQSKQIGSFSGSANGGRMTKANRAQSDEW